MLLKNNNKELTIIGFGFLLGIWFSLTCIFYNQVYYLWIIGFFGIGVCFAGFIYYWYKYNTIANVWNQNNKKMNNKGGS